MSVSNQRKNNSSGDVVGSCHTNSTEEELVSINNDKDDEPSKILQLIEKLSTTTNSIELQIIINNHVNKQMWSILLSLKFD